MQKLESRIDALERVTAAEQCGVIVLRDGESPEDALARMPVTVQTTLRGLVFIPAKKEQTICKT